MKLNKIISALVLLTTVSLFAKDLNVAPGSYNIDLTKYPFIDTTLNVIQFPKGAQSFEPFFSKMDTLVFENRGQIRILHIGGSHLQADVISGRIRDHLVKEYPGASAGRGFVFPYSAAKTNTPSTYASYYQGIWDKSKNVQKEVTKPLGLLGIAVSTSDPRAETTILLDKYNSEPMWGESKFRLFGYSDAKDVVPVLKVDSNEIMGMLDTASQSFVFKSPRPLDTIHIAFRWLDSLKQATVAQFIVDSLLQDSIARANADTTQKDSALLADTTSKAVIPANEALPENTIARDSMFQGECDVLDSACLARDEKNVAAANSGTVKCSDIPQKATPNYAEGELDETNSTNDHCIPDEEVVPLAGDFKLCFCGLLSIYTNEKEKGLQLFEIFLKNLQNRA